MVGEKVRNTLITSTYRRKGMTKPRGVRDTISLVAFTL